MSNPLENFPNLPPEVQEQILNRPALDPPPGLVSNFDNPDNRNAAGYGIAIACFTVASISFIIRVYYRARVLRKWTAEDYLASVGFLAYTGTMSSLFIHFHYCGYLVSQWDIRLKTFLIALQNMLPLIICCAVSSMFGRAAILIQWANIFNPNGFHNSFFWANRIILVVSILLSSATILSEILSCVPVRAHWQPWVNARCFNRKPLEFTATYACIIIDFAILLLPQNTIWKLNMNRIKKAGLSAIFSVGILVCLCPVGRAVFIHHLKYNAQENASYELGKQYIVGVAENTFIILVFCMPTIPAGLQASPVGRVIAQLLQSMGVLKPSEAGVKFVGPWRSRRRPGAACHNSSALPLSLMESQLSSKHMTESGNDESICHQFDIESRHSPADTTIATIQHAPRSQFIHCKAKE
ncbi:hypothetical protein AAL_07631 [Moelleriella libera RCEF 2490]|uniref:Rhodopsin domain-containing protein n=1 Tax=Moelleriella libera RCEF 2490 TaxID=1081109 RepID=A0A167X7V3_9HYPO|nr:hypothetical protein AAL_07631 [Moelleriella libera RCEF 2490]